MRPSRKAVSPQGKKQRAPERRSLVENVYQIVLKSILTGEYEPGTVLSELAVSKALGVSRTPVHDALRQLAKDGLIVREQNRRALVTGLTIDDVFEVFEMRKILEGPAAELAAGRMDRRHLAPLRAGAGALQNDPEAPDWIGRWADYDEEFHQTIAEASGNRRLAHDIGRYRLLHKAFNRMATDPVCLRQAMAEHIAILDALENGQPAQARSRMVAHIGVWQDFFMRNLPRRDDLKRDRSRKAKQ